MTKRLMSGMKSFAVFTLLALMWTCQAQAAPKKAHLTWTASPVSAGEAITGYKIYRATTAGGEGGTAFATVSGAATVVFDDATIAAGATYFYKVTETASCDPAVLDCSTFVAESAPSNEASTGVVPFPLAPAIGAPQATVTLQ